MRESIKMKKKHTHTLLERPLLLYGTSLIRKDKYVVTLINSKI